MFSAGIANITYESFGIKLCPSLWSKIEEINTFKLMQRIGLSDLEQLKLFNRESGEALFFTVHFANNTQDQCPKLLVL